MCCMFILLIIALKCAHFTFFFYLFDMFACVNLCFDVHIDITHYIPDIFMYFYRKSSFVLLILPKAKSLTRGMLCLIFTHKARFLYTLNLTLDTCEISPQAII